MLDFCNLCDYNAVTIVVQKALSVSIESSDVPGRLMSGNQIASKRRDLSRSCRAGGCRRILGNVAKLAVFECFIGELFVLLACLGRKRMLASSRGLFAGTFHQF
jgi:hypothetical protein